MAYGLNTTVVIYRLLEGGPVRLELRPALQLRGHDDPVSMDVPEAYPLTATGSRIELAGPASLPHLRLHVGGQHSTFVVEPLAVPDMRYTTEESRGYASRGRLYSPGRFRAELVPDAQVAFIASTESWETIATLPPEELVAAETERRRRLLDRGRHPRHAAVPPRSSSSPPISSSSARPVAHEDHMRARARRRSRGR